MCVKLSRLELSTPLPPTSACVPDCIAIYMSFLPSRKCLGAFNHIVRMLGLHTLIYSSADSNIMTLHADFEVLSNLSGESGTGGGFVGSTSVVRLLLSLL